MSSVFVRFEHVPESRQSEELGPFNFAQITYDALRVENPDGTMDDGLADFDIHTGKWFTSCFGPAQYDEWTDIVIFTKTEKDAV
jgi:hypothetical protein